MLTNKHLSWGNSDSVSRHCQERWWSNRHTFLYWHFRRQFCALSSIGRLVSLTRPLLGQQTLSPQVLELRVWRHILLDASDLRLAR